MTSPRLAGSRREVMHLAWPIGVSMMSFTLKGFVDMAMVGQLGTDALGAVGFASIATWFALCFPWGILRGQRPLVSQHIGAQQKDLAFSFGAHAFYLAFLSGLLLIIFQGPLVNIFGHFAADTAMTPEAIDIGKDYYGMRLWWLLPTLLTFAIAEYLRSTGRTRMPMAVDLLAHPLNLLFNYLLIFGHWGLPALGARGAAIGTGLADLIGLAVIAWLSRPRKKLPLGALRVNLSKLKEVVAVGWTGGIQFSLENLSFLSITWIVGHTNQAALAVHQAGIQLIHLSLLPAVAIGDAGSVLIGRYVGEMDWDGVKRTLRSILEIMLPFMGMMSLVFFFFGRPLSGIFLHDDDPVVLNMALDLGQGVMIAAALWQLGDALQIAFRFALRAAGDHHWVMWTGILCTWLLSIPLAWWVVFGFTLDPNSVEAGVHGSVDKVWLVWSGEIFVGSAIFVWRWRSGSWMRHRLVKDEASEVPA